MSKLHKKGVGATLGKRGVIFRVWAPFATAVGVVGSFNDWQQTPLGSEGDGYWSARVISARAGQEYKFVITNGQNTFTRNDPRALHLTASTGISLIVDRDFDWEDDDFKPVPRNQQVIYELHVGTFNRRDPSVIGTFQDVIDKLDYLSALGVNMLELMPVTTMMMGSGWSYSGIYIYAIESLYGGRHGLLNLVKAAHQRGIGIILDVVYNHFGPDSFDLWQFDGWSDNNQGGIYFYNDWRAETPWGNTRPDFGRPEVQQYILDNVAMLLNDYRIDGLRVDSTHNIRNVKGFNDNPATDIPEGWRLLQHITGLAKKINPSAILIAEDLGCNDYITKPNAEGGAGFMAQWEFSMHQTLVEVLGAGQSGHINFGAVCQELGKAFNNEPFGRVIFSDSHDSAANGGTRLNEAVAPGQATSLFARKQSLVAAALVLTTPGIPMLFQGQEFMEEGAFENWRELDWHKAERYKGIITAYQHLVTLRKNIYGNTAGLVGKNSNILHCHEDNKVIAYHRWDGGGPGDDVLVVMNFSNKSYPAYRLPFPREGVWRVRFNSTWKGYDPDFKGVEVPDITAAADGGVMVLPPNAAIILSQDK